MGFFKRLAFYVGLAAGVASVAAAGAAALTYLFTGKFSAFEVGREGARVKLMTVDEISALVREQMAKARSAAPSSPAQGGEYHGEG